MGWDARIVDQLSFWELAVAADGYNKAHGGETEIAPLTAEEYERDLFLAAERAAARVH